MTRQDALAKLAEDLGRLAEGASRPPRPRVSTGIEPLDRLFPDGGIRAGSFLEWLSAGDGAAAATFATRATIQICSQHRMMIIIDDRGQFHPPSLGRAAREILVVRPTSQAEALWAAEQALACPAVGAVVAWAGRLPDRAGRRLQLAAEHGSAVGMLIRPAREEKSPCWAEARFRVEPIPTAGNRRARVSLVRCRGGQAGGSTDLEIDDETGAVRLVPQLAAPAPLYRQRGA